MNKKKLNRNRLLIKKLFKGEIYDYTEKESIDINEKIDMYNIKLKK